jgi:hypothetical protein
MITIYKYPEKEGCRSVLGIRLFREEAGIEALRRKNDTSVPSTKKAPF